MMHTHVEAQPQGAVRSAAGRHDSLQQGQAEQSRAAASQATLVVQRKEQEGEQAPAAVTQAPPLQRKAAPGQPVAQMFWKKLGLGALGVAGGVGGGFGGAALAGALGVTAATGVGALAAGGALLGAGLLGGLGYLGYKGIKRLQSNRRINASVDQIAQDRPELAQIVDGIQNRGQKAWVADVLAHDRGTPDAGNPGAFNTAANLGFEPRMKFDLTPGDFAAYNAGPRTGDPNMNFNPATREVHTAYNPQQLAEIDRDFNLAMMQADDPTLMFGGQLPRSALDQAHGSPQALRDAQQYQVDLLRTTYQRVNNFGFNAFDQRFDDAALQQHETDLGNAANAGGDINVLLNQNAHNHEGFALGEDHGDPTTRQFIADNLQDMAQNQGVNTLYIENIRHEYQGVMDQWLANAGAGHAMPRELDAFVNTWDANNSGANMNGSLRRLLETAKDEGVRVRSIDHMAAQADMAAARNDELSVRDATMNTFGEGQIRNDAPHRGVGKYVILAGQAHNNTQRPVNESVDGRLEQGIPGFSQLLNIPALTVNQHGRLELDREDRTQRNVP
ncbi:MAG: hypothetical protein AAGB22_00785 [Bacteroidota bacterium]